MKNILMVAEKPSLAASLAEILSNKTNSTRKAFNNACSVHEWVGQFKNEKVKFKMTSVCGHVMGLAFIGKYNSWDRVDPIELFSCAVEKKEVNPKVQIPNLLAQEAKGCSYLVLWLDCDKEGENICFEVMNAVARSIQNVYSDQVTYRAKFSAITEKDIKYAMNNLIQPNENEAKSVDARQELDLRIGCAFTRFQTKFFQRRYGNLDCSLVSFGPCQTPTLGFCVARQDEILTFKAEPYWYIQVTSGNPEFILEWARGRVFKREIAQMFLNNLKKYREALVESVVAKDSARTRPLALNTVELMRAASGKLGLGPHTAMLIAEKLYIQGFISYPRTETTNYSPNFDLMGTCKILENSSELGSEVRDIIKDFNNPRKGVDCGDHPPITPMKLAHRNDMDSNTWRIYEYICRHFLATVSRDLKFKATTAKIRIESEVFSCTTNVLIDPGYTKVMTWSQFGQNDRPLPFVEGEMAKLNDIKICEGATSPPDFLTESELITLMEEHGIGTDASIPVHINNICQRNYVTVATGRKLIPTTLGAVLVHGYQKIDHELVLPTMRNAVEKQLNSIARGEADFNSILKNSIEMYRWKFLYFVQNIEAMDSLFEASFEPLANTGKAFTRCGKCRRYMKYIESPPSRLVCTHCGDTYNLPNGVVKGYKELKCPLDNFELLTFSNGTNGKSYPLCPYCYHHTPFPEMPKLSGCNACTHPTCPHSMTTLGISNCVECDNGVLVLDSTSTAKKWKLCCNSCDVIIKLFKDAIKLEVDQATCNDCGAQLVNVAYKSDNNKFKDGKTEKTGCIFCFPDFIPLIEKHKAIATSLSAHSGNNKNVRGRGGSRGGRGGGNNQRGGKNADKMAQLAAFFV